MILVTGGTGLVGSHLLFELVRNNEMVRAIHRPGSNLDAVRYVFSLYSEQADILFNKIEWLPGDLEDPESLSEALNGIQHVYHCAAMVSFDPREKMRMISCNVQGTAYLVNACLDSGITKLCYVSSTSALGSAPEGSLVTEDQIWSSATQRSAYSYSKFHSEMEVWRGITEGLNAVIVNPSIIIGPGLWGRSSSRLFSAVWKGMKFYTEGVTGYVDIKDVISSMIKLMSTDISGERYIVSSENLSYRQVLQMIARELGRPAPSKHADWILISLAWRLDWLKHLITGQKRSITRNVVRSSRHKVFFSNKKITGSVDLSFSNIADSVRETAGFYLEHMSHKSKSDVAG